MTGAAIVDLRFERRESRDLDAFLVGAVPVWRGVDFGVRERRRSRSKVLNGLLFDLIFASFGDGVDGSFSIASARASIVVGPANSWENREAITDFLENLMKGKLGN